MFQSMNGRRTISRSLRHVQGRPLRQIRLRGRRPLRAGPLLWRLTRPIRGPSGGLPAQASQIQSRAASAKRLKFAGMCEAKGVQVLRVSCQQMSPFLCKRVQRFGEAQQITGYSQWKLHQMPTQLCSNQPSFGPKIVIYASKSQGLELAAESNLPLHRSQTNSQGGFLYSEMQVRARETRWVRRALPQEL